MIRSRAIMAAIIMTASALLPLPAASQTAAPPAGLDEVVAVALRNNPELVQARLRADSAHAEQRIARGLANPILTVAPGNPFQYAVAQPLDIGPNRLYRTRAAGQGLSATRLDVANTTREVLFAVRQGFLDLLLAEAVRGVAAEQDTIVRQLLQSDSLRFRDGDLALRELSTTELQFAHADANLARAEAGVRASRINLQLRMGVQHPDPAFRASGTLDYRPVELPLDSLQTIALLARPDAGATRARVDQSRSLASLANSLLVPVPALTGVYQSEPFPSGSRYALGVSFSVPILNWFGGERERATAGLRAAEVSSQQTVAQIEGDVVAATDNFRAAGTLAARYASGLLDKARATLDMQRYAYEHGSASLLDLLNAINGFGDTQTDYFNALHDYWVAAYAIDHAVGRDLVP